MKGVAHKQRKSRRDSSLAQDIWFGVGRGQTVVKNKAANVVRAPWWRALKGLLSKLDLILWEMGSPGRSWGHDPIWERSLWQSVEEANPLGAPLHGILAVFLTSCSRSKSYIDKAHRKHPNSVLWSSSALALMARPSTLCVFIFPAETTAWKGQL